jgi:ABC-2 type transport system permease protein
MALGMPMALVLFFGFVYDFNVRDIRVAVFDRDQTKQSRELIEVFSSSQYFKVTRGSSQTSPLPLLDRETAKAVLIIEPGFGKKIKQGEPASVQMVIDGADNQSAGMIAGYLGGIRLAATERLMEQKIKAPILLKTRYLFNPELNSRWFVIPGLVVVVIGILSILLTALTVAREWESGSMELLLSTPVQPMEIIIGKLTPYTILGLGGVALVYLAARIGFGVPFKGSHLLFILTCLMFLSTCLSQGLVISVVTRQQQLAMQLANISGMLPSLLLSGFIFPVESMSTFFQYFTSIIPAKWFMVICRGIFLKGATAADLIKPLIGLGIMNVLFLTVASRKFKKDLEP